MMYAASGVMIFLAAWNGYDCIICSNLVTQYSTNKIRVMLILRILLSAALIIGAGEVV